jgi:peptide/nickel transport system ATP-binding protein
MEILNLERPMGGRIEVLGQDTSGIVARPRSSRCAAILQVVFQDPMASLDPRLPIGDILAEPLRTHGFAPGQISTRVRELIELVGLRPEHVNRYPQAFSGGQRQRGRHCPGATLSSQSCSCSTSRSRRSTSRCERV